MPVIEPAKPYDRDAILGFLERRQIPSTTHDHEAVFTVAESENVKVAMPGAHSKNLFLKDKKGQLWLVSAAHDATVDLKRLHKTIGSDRLSFGSAELLEATLGVKPGSVTALAMINDRDRKVRFVLDKTLHEAEIVNFHPMTNTATTAFSRDAFRAFMSAIGVEPLVVDLETLEAVQR
jgi:Ala-tRNA(Pro) deacylase